jgi:hypothetical protein
MIGRFGPKLLLNQVISNPDIAVFPLRMVINTSDLYRSWKTGGAVIFIRNQNLVQISRVRGDGEVFSV